MKYDVANDSSSMSTNGTMLDTLIKKKQKEGRTKIERMKGDRIQRENQNNVESVSSAQC